MKHNPIKTVTQITRRAPDHRMIGAEFKIQLAGVPFAVMDNIARYLRDEGEKFAAAKQEAIQIGSTEAEDACHELAGMFRRVANAFDVYPAIEACELAVGKTFNQ